MLKRSFSMIVALAAVLILHAQERYAVHVGNFMEARGEDFASLRSIGFVYANPVESGVSRIMLGGYDSKTTADRAVNAVRAKGYPNAYAQQVFLNEGMNVTIIQIGAEKSSAKINWERYAAAGELYGIIGPDDIRIATGPYANTDEARKQLDGIRKTGFKDAFIRVANSMTLHRLTEFETGIKKPLIPLNIQPEQASTRQHPSIAVIPPAYEATQPRIKSPEAPTVAASTANVPPTTPVALQARSGSAVALIEMPVIRSNVKRRSVLELQQALKAEGAYTGNLDGLYGNGTASAFAAFASTNRQMLRYKALSENITPPGLTPAAMRFQQALNAMHNDQAAVVEVTTSIGPLAKAYQAYVLFTSRGASTEVNQLMNIAIKESFEGRTLRKSPPFDTRAAYAYTNLDQLLLHIHYLHSAPGNAVTAPCWLAKKHPAEMARVHETYADFADGDFPFRGCDQLASWPEIAMLNSMAQDLGVNTPEDTQAAAKRAKLFSAPPPPLSEEEVSLENWNIRLWKGLDSWAQRDPLNQDMVRAFRVTYHQAEVRLEDHFMDKGFNAAAARSLALSTLQTIVGHHLQRFL